MLRKNKMCLLTNDLPKSEVICLLEMVFLIAPIDL